ncbi:RICIN domain-containing protein [Streptomyces sp. NPDC059783]|uniref:RICIN domain-containing protein n=1 Tax=Streptomyces sp. NPDC059783 TaxID=3346944 RepID=UPI00365DB1BC
MRQLRLWSDLSYRQIERNATQAGDVLPRATISGALARTDLPREELLAAFVRACGGDTTTVDTWLTARRELAITAEPTAPPQPPQPREHTHDDVPPGAVPQEADGVTSPSGTEAAEPSPDPQPPLDGQPSSAPEPSSDSEASSAAEPAAPPSTTHPADPSTPTTAERAEPPPSPRDQDTRPRYLPMTLTGALAAAGVLLIALWPGADKPVSTHPGDTPAPSPANSTPPTVSSPTASTPTPTADPVGAGTEESSGTPTTRPTTKRSAPPSPSPRRTPRPARTPPTGVVQIHPVDDPALCLTEGRERNGRTQREIAVQNPCAQDSLPTVSLVPAGAQTYLIQWDNPAQGIGCLAVDGASTSPGALLAPRGCTDAASQKYRFEPVAGGFRLRPVHSGLCVGILTPRTSGAEAIQQNCTGTDDQTFRVTAS